MLKSFKKFKTSRKAWSLLNYRNTVLQKKSKGGLRLLRQHFGGLQSGQRSRFWYELRDLKLLTVVPRSSRFMDQLIQKRKVRSFYGLAEYKLKGLYLKASSLRCGFSQNMVVVLESRLPVILFRAGIAKTIQACYQLVSHGKVFVDGVVVLQQNYHVSPGALINCKWAGVLSGLLEKCLTWRYFWYGFLQVYRSQNKVLSGLNKPVNGYVSYNLSAVDVYKTSTLSYLCGRINQIKYRVSFLKSSLSSLSFQLKDILGGGSKRSVDTSVVNTPVGVIYNKYLELLSNKGIFDFYRNSVLSDLYSKVYKLQKTMRSEVDIKQIGSKSLSKCVGIMLESVLMKSASRYERSIYDWSQINWKFIRTNRKKVLSNANNKLLEWVVWYNLMESVRYSLVNRELDYIKYSLVSKTLRAIL